MQDSLHHLDTIQDPHHLSYKVPGLLVWFVLGLGFAGTLLCPQVFVMGAQIFTLALAIRLLVTLICYLFGLLRCRQWQTSSLVREEVNPDGVNRDDIHHVVLIPNYREPVELLENTLNNLAEQEGASRCITVVLAMEEREPGAYEKACALRDQYASQFARVLVTIHPTDLPGEIAGKGSNQAWAARQVRRELIDRLGLPIHHLTLTSCDADSVLHPRYLVELADQFANDPKRHRRFWCAPVFYQNNIWEVPAVVRLLSFGAAASRLAELAGPLSKPLPESTYSFSFMLADQVGYWDPAVISEDWHMYLRCYFATHGQISVKRIFLPFSSDSVSGKTFWQALINYYRQRVRHAWGAQDVGYVLQQWHRSPGTPYFKKLFCLTKVTMRHLLWSASWFLLIQGWLLSIQSQVNPGDYFQMNAILPEPFRYFGIVWTAGTALGWFIERIRSRPGWQGWRLTTLVTELITWLMWPVVGLVLFALPALHAQTKLMLGSQLVYHRTPKALSQRMSVGQHLLEE